MSSSSLSTGSHPLIRALRPVIPLLLLAALVTRVGTHPFERSLQVLAPLPIIAALLLGMISTTAQAMRWRTVAIGYQAASGLTRGRALGECYRSTLLNAVLPGGVMGDAVRAWRQRGGRERGFRSSAQVVIGERVAGTALLLAAVAVAVLPLQPWVALAALGGAVIAVLVATPSLKRLPVRGQFAVWGWSLLALAALVTKFAVVALWLGTASGVQNLMMLALIVLAGMSVPVGIGGFGPREAVAAVAFAAIGRSADAGVATSAGYGVLAAVSALPGVVVMLLDLRGSHPTSPTSQTSRTTLGDRVAGLGPKITVPAVPRDSWLVSGGLRPAGSRQVEFEADVLSEQEPAGRSA